MAQKNATQYDARDIEVLSGLEPVQKRPGMYTITTNPNHLAQEVIDNSTDEALAGHANEITVTLHADHSLSVADNGRGMPVDIHPDEKISGVEVILTRLHAGAKFSQKNYQFAGGLHGVGVSVVNALSAQLIATIDRGGVRYQMRFAHGAPQGKLKNIDTVPKKQTGTHIHFWPEGKYFDSDKFHVPKLIQALQAKAVLCPGLTIHFVDEKAKQKQTWCYADGLKTYVQEKLQAETTLPEEAILGEMLEDEFTIHYAVCWLTAGQNILEESYVNLIPTVQGGTHVNGFRTGLSDAIREFCQFRDLLPKNLKLTPEDVWAGCQYVLSFKMHDPQFAGQTKERLTSRQAAPIVATAVKNQFALWLHQHVKVGEQIAALAIEKAEARNQAARTVSRKKIVQGPALPGKLADCTVNDPMRAELFLVEGDSAGGSAKQARDKTFQAVMPLRGKILNTWEVSSTEVLASQEVHDIAVAIGMDPDSEDLTNLRYGKVCILADADSDGAHIATLLCALFVKHFPKLVEKGHVFVAMPPLYRLDVGKQIYYALDDNEKTHLINKIRKEKPNANVSIQRFKGLGEMNPLQLRETTMVPDTRRLVQLTLENKAAALGMLDMLLAKKRVSDRKQWLEDKGDLAEVSIT